MTPTTSDRWRQTIGRRVTVTAALLAAWFVVIEGRLVQLQVLQHEAIKLQAEGQHLDRVGLPAPRGDITDRHGLPLSRDVDAPTILADPRAITTPLAAVDALCGALADCTPARRKTLTDKLTAPTRFEYVERHASLEQAGRVAELKQTGISITFEPKRVHPNGELAAHVIGIVGIDHEGLEGIEKRYDEVLKGRPGEAVVKKDAKDVVFNRRVETPPLPGADLELTLDGNMQSIVERELAAGVAENRAAGGCVVVMDPSTGEILALAGFPTFDPNDFERSNGGRRRNCATQNTYEPGSTMKIVTAAAALERRIVGPDDRIDVSAGRITVGPKDVIVDSHRHGVLTFAQVIANSSNVGTIKVAQTLGREGLTHYVRLFGFGRLASPDFGGQASGRVWDPAALTTGALARVSIGYQISVTALQMAAAMSSIANGGELLRPRIVRAVITNDRRAETQKTVVNRTVSPEAAAQLIGMMEEAVESGTGTYAKIPGYTVAGKTGTAEKLVDGAYSKTEHMASFVGIVPSRKPAFTIVVVIDSPAMNGPNGHFGGPVAGRIFKRIAEALLHYTGEPPTINPPRPLIVPRSRDSVDRVRAAGPVHGGRVVMVVDRGRTQDGLFPDLSGIDGRDAIATLTGLGVQVVAHGDGLVVSQAPAPGTPIERGATVTVRLDRVDVSRQQGNVSR